MTKPGSLEAMDSLASLFDSNNNVDVRIRNALWDTSFCDLEGLGEATAQELLDLPNFGKVCLNRVRQVLADHGLKLASDRGAVPKAEPTLKQQMAEILARLDRIEQALKKG